MEAQAPYTPTYPRQLECGDVEYAFTSGGIDFFKMVNPDNLPIVRYHKAQDYMLEISYRVDDDILAGHNAAVIAACNKGDLVTVAYLTMELEKRRQWLTDVLQLYKLATCYYFAKDEEPTRYDPQRAQKHIALWVQEAPNAFFLKSQLHEFLPSFEFAKQNINRFTELQAKTDKIKTTTLLNALQSLSTNGSAKETITMLQSRVQILTALESSAAKG